MSARETVQLQHFAPDVREWKIAPLRASFFVENEVMAPGWKAFVDEKPAKIHLANAIFRGVSVPAGSQKIALVYDSQTLRFALFLALCGLGLATFHLVAKRQNFGA